MKRSNHAADDEASTTIPTARPNFFTFWGCQNPSIGELPVVQKYPLEDFEALKYKYSVRYLLLLANSSFQPWKDLLGKMYILTCPSRQLLVAVCVCACHGTRWMDGCRKLIKSLKAFPLPATVPCTARYTYISGSRYVYIKETKLERADFEAR